MGEEGRKKSPSVLGPQGKFLLVCYFQRDRLARVPPPRVDGLIQGPELLLSEHVLVNPLPYICVMSSWWHISSSGSWSCA